MTIGRVLISWTAAAFWLVGGLLLLAAGYYLEAFAVAASASIAVAVLVSAAPLRPVAALSVGLALLYVGLAAALVVIEPNVLAGAAACAYAAAAFFSSGALRDTSTQGSLTGEGKFVMTVPRMYVPFGRSKHERSVQHLASRSRRVVPLPCRARNRVSPH